MAATATVEVRVPGVENVHALTRRTFLLGLGAAAVATACGGDGNSSGNGGSGNGGSGNGATTATDKGAPSGPVLGAGFANGYSADPAYVAGVPQRLPFVLFEGPGKPQRNGLPDSIEINVRNVATKQTVLTQKVARHGDGIPTPYFPLVFTADAPGDFEATLTGSSVPAPFRIVDRAAVKLVQAGDPLRPVDTPTTASAKGVTPICTRSPQCPLHAVSLKDALATPGPLAFLVSTPGFCQTAICGPVLDLLLDARAAYPSMRMIHAEVYVDPVNDKNRKTTPAVETYGLTFEPSLVVANAAGKVTARLDFTWDRADLKAALDTAV